MARTEDTPTWIGQMRSVLATSLLAGTADLRGYPHPYLSIISNKGFKPSERIAMALAAAELLHVSGWDLVTVTDNGATREVFAIMRRR
jgi:hypothetical protein